MGEKKKMKRKRYWEAGRLYTGGDSFRSANSELCGKGGENKEEYMDVGGKN